MLSVEEYEKRLESGEQYAPVTSNVGSLLSVYDTMDFQQKQTASDKAANAWNSFMNGVKGVGRGTLQGLLANQYDNYVHAEETPGEITDDDADLDSVVVGALVGREAMTAAANSDILKPKEVQANSAIERYAYNAIEGIGQLGAQAVTAMIPGVGEIAAPASMYYQILGSEYDELRAQGVDHDTAYKAAQANAIIQAPMESLSLSKMMKSIPANTLAGRKVRMFADKVLTEAVTEGLQQFPEDISKLYALNPDKTASEIARMAWDKKWELIGNALYAGAVATPAALLGGGISMVVGRQEINRAIKKEMYNDGVAHVEDSVNRIKETGINPPYAAAVVNDNMQNQTVYVDGESLAGYAQEKGAEKVAESLGVSVEDIEKAAADGSTVDVKLGNYEATCAAFDGFFQEVKDDTAFEDGGYTPKKEEAEREQIKRDKQRFEALRDKFKAEEDRIISEFNAAGVGKQIALGQVELLKRFAENINPDYALSIMQNYKVRRGENGDVQMGYGQFAGENAETADKVKLAEAQKMESEGKAADEIYKATGWFKGMDNRWRFEIPDNLNDIDFSGVEKFGELPLARVYYNEALFDAYPELRQIKVQIDESLDNKTSGETSLESRLIKLNKNELKDKNEAAKTIVHEVQHLIQDIEEHAAGGSPKGIKGFLRAHIKALTKVSKEMQKANPSFARLTKAIDGLGKAAKAQAENPRSKAERDAVSAAFQELKEARNELSAEDKEKLEPLAWRIRELTRAANSQAKAYDLYRRLGGEQEAREAEGRAEDREQLRQDAEATSQYLNDAAQQASGAEQKTLAKLLELRDKFFGDDTLTDEQYDNLIEQMEELKEDLGEELFGKYEQYEEADEAYRTYEEDVMPQPHKADAIIIFNGVEIPYRQKQDKSLADAEEQNTMQAKSRSKESGFFDAMKSLFQAAWHGSPYKFIKFDLGAIGTGEGAQVHGWGLYFAQDRAIAEDLYKERLGNPTVVIDGETYQKTDNGEWGGQAEDDTGVFYDSENLDGGISLALVYLEDSNGDKQKAIESLEKSDEDYKDEAIEFLTDANDIQSGTGFLYQVEIPDNDVLLDEQKTFEEQPEKVQNALYDMASGGREYFRYKATLEGREYITNQNEEWIDKETGAFAPKDIVPKLDDIAESDYSFVAGEIGAEENISLDLEGKTGREIYRQLSQQLGSDRAASELLNKYGIEGIAYEGGQDGRCFVVFDDQAINIIDTYNQEVNGQGEIKGKYNPYDNVVTMFKGADASTVIHETWHFFVEQMWNMVQSGNASEQTVKDFETLLNYAGMTMDEWAAADLDGRRKAHEKLAEAGETYVMEGKSPSMELRRIFKNFAKWLKAIYQTIQRSENYAELTDDVREVFDRMLAAEDDIAHMERVNGYFSKLPDVITENMSDATRAKVEDYIDKAREKAVDILTRRSLVNYTKERRKEIKKFKDEIRPMVEDEVSKRPVYACGYDKKDAARFRELRTLQDEAGSEEFLFRAELTAERYGYSSADEMMQDIEKSPTKAEAVRQRINERVQELTMQDERNNYEAMVRESLYNEDEALLIGVEQQLIEEYAAKAKERQEVNEQKAEERKVNAEVAAARKQQAKNAARADLAKMNVKEATRTSKFITAERNAAMKCAKLLAQKKFDDALTQKNLQAYWHAMAAESMKIQRRQKQFEKFLKRQVKLKPEAWLNETHFAAISQLFVRMNIAKPIHKEAAAQAQYETIDAYATAMEELFDCVDIAPWIRESSFPISDTNALTLEQYEDVVNAIKNIKAIVKAQKGVNTFNRQETWENTKNLMMEKLSALRTIWTPNPNKPTKATAMERFTASMETLDSFLEYLDDATYGWFSQTWGNLIKRASDKEYEYREAYDKADADALKKWLPDEAAEKAANEEVYYDELGTSATKHTLVKMLINLGNKENSQRLCETVPVGFERSSLWIMPDEFTDRQTAAEETRKNLIDFLGRVLTKKDVEYAQAKINAAEMFWGEKNDLERRVKGFGLKKVEATPVELHLGEGLLNNDVVVLRGGYFPLMRNGETGSHAASAEVQDDDPLQGRRIRTYHTNTSATKARTNARYPVNLFPGAETQWIYESIHDLCWREVMNDFRRVLNDQELFAMLKSKIGTARMQVFKEMLEVCADPRNSKSASEGESMLGDAAAWLRRKTSHAVIMWNLKVIAQNYANAFLYGNAVEGYTMADNFNALGMYFFKYFSPEGRKEMREFVFSKSAYMRERSAIPDITVRDIVDDNKEFSWTKMFRETGIKAMAFTDNHTAIPNWLTAYNKKLNEGATEQEAIDYADAIVRRVLGSSRITEVASIQRGGEIMKLMTMFQSFFNARFNEFLRMERLTSKQWTTGQKQAAFANVMSYAISKWLGQTILAMLLAVQNPLGVDDKDKWPDIIKELKSYSFSMMGPVGQFANAIVGAFAGMHEYTYRMSAIESTLDKVARTGKKLYSDKATTQDKVEAITDVAGMGFDVPAQLNRILWNAVDILLNGMDPEIGDIMRRRPKKERK